MGSRMKHTLRDLTIAILTMTGIVSLYRARTRKRGPLVRVLVFHDVKDGVWFLRIIRCLKKRYHLITPTEFIQGEFDPIMINVLITFDDGYRSWTDICAPVLQTEKVTALFFVNSGLLMSYENSEAQKEYVEKRLLLTPRETLSWKGLVELTRRGHTIGGHTTTHARLSELQEDMQQIEIEADKAVIEFAIGTPLRAFAYPFGQGSDYTEKTQKLVSESGYSHAFTTEGVFVEHGKAYAISRLCLEEGMSMGALHAWVEGGYDVYRTLKKLCVG